jgi:type II secretory pathway pseudopilin PulG
MKNIRAKSFVAIMMVIAVSALLLRFGIERIIKLGITKNESDAQATLKLISTALDNYAAANHSLFPASLSVLIQTTPHYIDKDYIDESPIKGYNYSCLRLEASGYSCSANPTSCKLTGTMVYTITTGGLLVSEKCERKE